MTLAAAKRSYDFGTGPVDHSRYFMPERFSPLYFTPWLARLSADQRRRYNQLHTLYFNEQLMFFEDSLAESVLGAALKTPLPAALADSLRDFIAEERDHSAMFRRLNRLSEDFYADRDYHFISVPRAAQKVLAWASARPNLFPMFLWIMLLQEERAIHYSREIIRPENDFEPHFAAVHRLHLADEVGHVRHDRQLINLLWKTCPALLRSANVVLLRYCVGEFFSTPKRACLRVLGRLAFEFPELVPDLPELKRAVRALERDPVYHESLYSRAVVPESFALFDECPELATMSRVMLGYHAPN